MWQQRIYVLQLQTLTNCSLNPKQADPILILKQLTDSAHATVTQVVNVIDFTVTILQAQQVTDRLQYIVFGQGPLF